MAMKFIYLPLVGTTGIYTDLQMLEAFDFYIMRPLDTSSIMTKNRNKTVNSKREKIKMLENVRDMLEGFNRFNNQTNFRFDRAKRSVGLFLGFPMKRVKDPEDIACDKARFEGIKRYRRGQRIR